MIEFKRGERPDSQLGSPHFHHHHYSKDKVKNSYTIVQDPTHSSSSSLSPPLLRPIDSHDELKSVSTSHSIHSIVTTAHLEDMVNPGMQWEDWIKDYSRGKFPNSHPPVKPKAIQDLDNIDTSGSSTTTDSSTDDGQVSSPATSVPEELPIEETTLPNPTPSNGTATPPTTVRSSSSTSTTSLHFIPKPNSSSSTSLDPIPSTPEELLEFYKHHRYLPAPRGVHEHERLRTIKRYGLDKPARKEAIDRICRVAKAHFKTNTVIITLVLEDVQVLVAETGWIPGEQDPSPETEPRRTDIKPSLCRHAITRVNAKEPFIVPNAAEDFRFEKNPYNTTQGGSLAFYASANILVPTRRPTSPSFESNSSDSLRHSYEKGTVDEEKKQEEEEEEEGCPDELPVGSLCLIDNKPKHEGEFSEEDRRLLQDLAFMVGQEFQLGFEMARREVEQKRSNFIGGFLDSTLVYPSSSSSSSFTSSSPPPPAPISSSSSKSKFKSINSSKRPSPSVQMHHQHSAPSTRAINSSHPDPQLESSSSSTPPDLSPLKEFQNAARELRILTKSSGVAFFDLRSFRAPLKVKDLFGVDEMKHGREFELKMKMRQKQKKGTGKDMGAGRSVTSSPVPSRPNSSDGKGKEDGATVKGMGRVYLLGGDEGEEEEEGVVDWEEIAKNEKLPAKIVDLLDQYYDTHQTEFDPSMGRSPLLPLLPSNVTASCIVPVFDIDGSPALLLVLISTEKHFGYSKEDRSFVVNVGAVAISALSRQRAIEADRAKLAFVSQISHELRTPLHGINSQVELIREFSTPQQLLKLAPLLDVADVCLESLRDVLDDTLDFSKLSNNSPEEIEAAQKRSLARHDLETLAEDVSKAVWVRKKRVDLVSADANASNAHSGKRRKSSTTSEMLPGKVDVVLEVQKRGEGEGDWGVWVDAGGMKRVLLNILGNALKFTKDGHVKLTLSELPPQPSIELGPNQRVVELVVEDTGRGMSEEFLRDGKLFTPFVQENPFANGAGLGMSICDTIIRRMGGRLDVTSSLGKGTTVRILVPLEFCRLEDSSLPGSPILPQSIASFPVPPPNNRRISTATTTRYTRRIISDELTSLFSPGQPLASPHYDQQGSTTSNPPLDFERAVEMAQQQHSASLVSPRGEGTSSLRRTPSDKSNSKGGGRKLSFLGRKGTDTDFVDELAKLSVGTNASSPQAVNQGQPFNGDFFSLQPHPNRPSNSLEVRRASSNGLMAPPTTTTGMTQPQQEGFIPTSPAKRFAERVKVLIADDNAIGRSILTKLFLGKGIDFEQAENGQEAVEVYVKENGKFNLILADVQMPILDGIQASHEIRKYEESHNLPRCRIIALTGFAEDHLQSPTSENGPNPASSRRSAVDSWLVKGGKSLAVILREVRKLEDELIERESFEMGATSKAT